MRPHKLELKSFGSYVDQTIDFDAPRSNLFLISGDTGAGKTTIFDAISYALYGTKSSVRAKTQKVYKLVTSHFAKPGTNVEVRLTFSVGNGPDAPVYTVERRLETAKALKSGKTPDETLELKGPGIDPGMSKRETENRIARLVGLTREQFNQVALIAQGEFRELLTVKTSDRKKVFSHLFGTDIYDGIEQAVKDRAGKSEEEMKKLADRARENSGLEVPPEYPGADSFVECRTRLAGDSSGSGIGPFAEVLRDMCAWQRGQEELAAREEEQAQKALDSAREAHTSAKGIEETFRNLEAKRTELESMQGQQDKMQAREVRLQKIGRALEVKRTHDDLVEAEKRVSRMQADLAKLTGSLPGLGEAVEVAQKDQADADAALSEVSERCNGEKERADRAIQVFDMLQTEERALAGLQADLEAARARKAQIEKDAEQAASDVLRFQEEKEQEAMARAERAQIESGPKATAKRLCDDIREVEAAQAECAQSLAASQQAQAEFIKAQKALDKARDAYQTAHDAYYANAAGVLAEQLQEGEPCPVCGSKVHPQPAKLAEGGAPTLDRVRKLEQGVDARDREHQEAFQKATGAKTVLEMKTEAEKRQTADLLGSVERDIGCPRPEDFKAARAAIVRFGDEARKAFADADARVAKLAGAEDRLKDATGRREKLDAAGVGATREVGELGERVSAAQARVKTLGEQASFGSRELAQAAQRKAEDEISHAEERRSESAKRLSIAEKRYQACESRMEQIQTSLPADEQACERKRALFAAALKESTLGSDEWQGLAQDHDDAYVRRGNAEIQQFKEDLAAHRSAVATLEASVAGKRRPDMASLQQAVDAAQQRHNKARQSHTALQSRLQTSEEALGRVRAALREYERNAPRHAALCSLRDRLGSGKGSRVDLSTYAQRYYLRRVLAFANRRLQELSGNQYELRMASLEDANQGHGNTGLDLEVYSFVTGKTRDVTTLSGGESFTAALALALGMADEIEMDSGSTHLDVMFVDEGFGSLDEELCRRAVQSLRDMMGESTLVGIISHVSVLKQAIGDQLVVTKDDNGSHAHWIND